jgi:hypothetical protein
MSKAITASIIVLFFCIFTNNTQANECPFTSNEEQIAQADIIVSGEVSFKSNEKNLHFVEWVVEPIHYFKDTNVSRGMHLIILDPINVQNKNGISKLQKQKQYLFFLNSNLEILSCAPPKDLDQNPMTVSVAEDIAKIINMQHDSCSPYMCRDGNTFKRCENGTVLEYIGKPCANNGGEIGSKIVLPAFTDVPKNYIYNDAIEWATVNRVVNGYEDQTFRPENLVNRVEFLKIIYESNRAKIQKGNPAYYQNLDCFIEETASDFLLKSPLTDIDLNSWYGKYLCNALRWNIVTGYPDGTFKPGNSINFAEAAKIMYMYKYNGIEKEISSFQNWFEPYIDELQSKNALPSTYKAPHQYVTRGEMMQMMYQLDKSI